MTYTAPTPTTLFAFFYRLSCTFIWGMDLENIDLNISLDDESTNNSFEYDLNISLENDELIRRVVLPNQKKCMLINNEAMTSKELWAAQGLIALHDPLLWSTHASNKQKRLDSNEKKSNNHSAKRQKTNLDSSLKMSADLLQPTKNRKYSIKVILVAQTLTELDSIVMCSQKKHILDTIKKAEAEGHSTIKLMKERLQAKIISENTAATLQKSKYK